MIPSSSAWWISSSLAGISFLDLLYTIDTSSAPILIAVLALSIATFPAPTTTTFLPLYTGVALPSFLASIRFDLVRYSFALYTPGRFSPGIPWKDGSPAPVPIKTALYSSKSSSSSIVLPTTTLHLITTPSSLSIFISF